MHLLDRKELFDLASFLRALDERGRGRCVRHRSGNNELHSSSLPRPSLTRGRPFLPLSLFSVCAGVIRYEAANKSNKRVGGAVTGDTTYDVNLPPLLPPLPSNLRFIGLLRHDPPETRFVNSLVETRLTPGPASRPADQLHPVHLCLPLTRVFARFRVSF